MPISRPKRRAPRRLGAALAAVGALALVLTGCVGSPAPTPSPTPTEAAPIFASDEEALAAAIEAYERYRAASQRSRTTEAGSSPNGLRRSSSLEAMRTALHDEFAHSLMTGLRLTGPSSIDTDLTRCRIRADDGASVSASMSAAT